MKDLSDISQFGAQGPVKADGDPPSASHLGPQASVLLLSHTSQHMLPSLWMCVSLPPLCSGELILLRPTSAEAALPFP